MRRLRELRGPVLVAAGSDAHLLPLAPDEDTVAIELDFMQPACPLGRPVDQARQLQLDAGRPGYVLPASRGRLPCRRPAPTGTGAYSAASQ
jgi:hypothetical protein